MTIPTIQKRVNGDISQPGIDYDVPATPKVHPIRKLARLHHVCAVAVSEEYGVDIAHALDKLGGAVTSLFIESCRQRIAVTGDVNLPILSQE